LAAHTLVLMAVHARQSSKLITSEQIAISANTNPVVIRRILGQLKAAGLVESRRGVSAGWRLVKDPSQITLQDLYEAIEPGHLFALHGAQPNQQCVVGRGIQPVLTQRYGRADLALREELATTTVADLINEVVSAPRRRSVKR
jgi:Rrf2 family protein